MSLRLFWTVLFGIEMAEINMFDFHFLLFMSLVFELVFEVIALIFEFHCRGRGGFWFKIK